MKSENKNTPDDGGPGDEGHENPHSQAVEKSSDQGNRTSLSDFPGGAFGETLFSGSQLSPATRRLAGAGMALAAYALGLGGAGYFLDHLIGWKIPVIGIAGILLGFILGMIRLIRLAGQMNG